MNEHSLNDPQLQSFEARLTGRAPQASSREQQKLLYQCGVAAGRQASRRSLRRWRAACAALVVLSVGGNIPFERNFDSLATKHPSPPTKAAPWHAAPRQAAADVDVPSVPRPLAPVELDAWQTPPSPVAALDEQLAEFQQIDSSLRPLAMAALARSMLAP